LQPWRRRANVAPARDALLPLRMPLRTRWAATAATATTVWVLAACAGTPTPRDDATGGSHRSRDGGTLTLVNRTNEAVCYLYLSPPADENWGIDRLGSATIGPGERQTVQLPPGIWDLRTENCLHETTGVLHNARITHATTLVLQ
jgi:hypothetical protein